MGVTALYSLGPPFPCLLHPGIPGQTPLLLGFQASADAVPFAQNAFYDPSSAEGTDLFLSPFDG